MGIDISSLRTEDLPQARSPKLIEVSSGGAFDLEVFPVAKRINDETFAMLSYSGSIPGPTLKVRQGSEIAVNVINRTTMETTVHWHGLRLENRFDGVPHDTQAPVPPGGQYTHRLVFPDAGMFWYHPHMREDFAQEMGLYGNVLVESSDASYWPKADRDVVLTLDDLLIENGEITAPDPHGSNFTAMGRFGNVLLVGGETEQRLKAHRGEVLRFYLTNAANTRVFKVSLPGARLKLVGADAGRYEREEWIDDVVISPSERAIVDALFEDAGSFVLRHVTPKQVYTLASITVSEEPFAGGAAGTFEILRVNADMVEERERAEKHLGSPPDKTLALVAEMDMLEHSGEASSYVCPMHPEVISNEPGSCPKCGMPLMPAASISKEGEGQPAHSDHTHDHGDALADGVEWEDLMLEVNRMTTPANMRWLIIDRETGARNTEIDWTFEHGAQVKIRIINEMESDHPMQHPFHVHGQRFLVLSRNDVVEQNLVWKDTVLVRTGEVVDLLMDASNPGLWMVHCHIAEHLEAGMMFSFRVKAGGEDGG